MIANTTSVDRAWCTKYAGSVDRAWCTKYAGSRHCAFEVGISLVAPRFIFLPMQRLWHKTNVAYSLLQTPHTPISIY